MKGRKKEMKESVRRNKTDDKIGHEVRRIGKGKKRRESEKLWIKRIKIKNKL